MKSEYQELVKANEEICKRFYNKETPGN